MNYKLIETEIKHIKGTLKVKMQSGCKNIFDSSQSAIETSSEIVLCGLVNIKIQNIVSNVNIATVGWYKQQMTSIKITKVFKPDDMVYKIAVSSDKLKLNDKIFDCVSDDDNRNWQSLYHVLGSFVFEFDLTITLDIPKCYFPPFASLYEDNESADFELCGKDGSVKVHKAILAGYSPVIKTMLNGQWKETATGSYEVTGATKETLQHLKDYMYLHALPENGIDKLASLASMYMMPDLEEYCTVRLLKDLDEDNAIEILSLATKYKMEKLTLAILCMTKKGMFIDDMVKKFSLSKIYPK